MNSLEKLEKFCYKKTISRKRIAFLLEKQLSISKSTLTELN